MSTTIHFSVISQPELLDVVDDEWMQDTLADDGEHRSSSHRFVCVSSQLTTMVNVWRIEMIMN